MGLYEGAALPGTVRSAVETSAGRAAVDVRNAGLGLVNAVVQIFLLHLPGVARTRHGIYRQLTQVTSADKVFERLRSPFFVLRVHVNAFTKCVEVLAQCGFASTHDG